MQSSDENGQKQKCLFDYCLHLKEVEAEKEFYKTSMELSKETLKYLSTTENEIPSSSGNTFIHFKTL